MVGQPADQPRRNAELLERLVQPFGGVLVAVAVAQECIITLARALPGGRVRAVAVAAMRTGRADWHAAGDSSATLSSDRPIDSRAA